MFSSTSAYDEFLNLLAYESDKRRDKIQDEYGRYHSTDKT